MTAGAGDLNLRKENIERTVNALAKQNYVFKQSLSQKTSSSWDETYFTEAAADLTASGTRAIKGVSRLSGFPRVKRKFSKTTGTMIKYAAEDVISWEDAKTNEIDVIARTLLNISRAITKSVDDNIYTTISSNAGNTVTITAGNEWDSATIVNRDPLTNIFNAKQLLSEDNFETNLDGTELWISPKGEKDLLSNPNIVNVGQFWTDTPTKNGTIGMIAGLKVKVSNSVTADEAIVSIPKAAATWKTLAPLKVVSTEDPGIKWTIRAWEVGLIEINQPNAICKISNTAA